MLKDPNAVLPFSVDWSAWLTNEGDTAATATWTVSPGITQAASPAPSIVSGKATVWLSGGVDGNNYTATCLLTTTGGRTDERTISIEVRKR